MIRTWCSLVFVGVVPTAALAQAPQPATPTAPSPWRPQSPPATSPVAPQGQVVYVEAYPVAAYPAPSYYGAPPPRRRSVAVDYEGGPIPPGAVLRTRPMIWAIVTGASVLGVSWIWSAFIVMACPITTYSYAWTYGSRCPAGMNWLYLPVVGPFAALSDPAIVNERPLYILDGVLQVAGLVTLVAGAATQRRQLVMYSHGRSHPQERQWTVLPAAPGAIAGVSLVVTSF